MLHLSNRIRTAILSTLDTATAVDGGPTREQTGLLGALASHVLQVRPTAANVITPTDAAAVIEEPWLRRAVGETGRRGPRFHAFIIRSRATISRSAKKIVCSEN